MRCSEVEDMALARERRAGPRLPAPQITLPKARVKRVMKADDAVKNLNVGVMHIIGALKSQEPEMCVLYSCVYEQTWSQWFSCGAYVRAYIEKYTLVADAPMLRKIHWRVNI